MTAAIRFRLVFLGMFLVSPWLVGCASSTARRPIEDVPEARTPPPVVEAEPSPGVLTVVAVYEKKVRLSHPVTAEVSATARKTDAGYLWNSVKPAGETAAAAVGADGRTVGKMYQNIDASGKADFRLDAFLELGRDKVFSESSAGKGRELAVLLQEMPNGPGAAKDRTPPAFHAVLAMLRTLTCLEDSGAPLKIVEPGSPFPGGIVPAKTAARWKTEGVYVRRGVGPNAADLELKRLPGGRYEGTWSVKNWRTLPDMNESEPAPTAAKTVPPTKP